MSFYENIGTLALGSRLRHLSEQLTGDAAKAYDLYGVPLDPRWFPVFWVLSQQPEASITEIAKIIGHSHPSVSQIVKKMKKADLVVTAKSSQDARINVVHLSDKGKTIIPQFEAQCVDVRQAAEELLAETQYDLWNAIAEIEFLLENKSLLQRIQSVRKKKAHQSIEIIDYTPEYQADFKRLNCEWIEKYFTLEDTDLQSLNHPDEKILQPGGHIYLARRAGKIVGTCALIKMDETTYELAKMAVSERERGLGIGELIGQAAINKAQALGAQKVFLESNTRLKPAISLYQKLGFRKVKRQPSPYERCNIQMELEFGE
ncbi:MAG: bifunctional helix-turn-helix transcriptional regulator/GNAT family N-acetyltransferase [Cyanobacteria bacterium J06560_2]